MKHIKNRLPDRKNLILFLLTCIFPVHLWAIIQFLREISSYILWLSWFEIISVFSYTQAIALFESSFIFIGLTFLALCLPHKFILDHFLAQSTTILLFIVTFFMLYHYRNNLSEFIEIKVYMVYLIGILCIILFSMISYSIRKSDKIENLIETGLEQLSILSSLYLALAFLGLIFSITRIITTQILWII